MPVSRMASIQSFLALNRIAFAGVSRNPKHFSRLLMEEFRKRGYDVVPVNPNAEEIAGVQCAAKVSAVRPQVDGVMVMTPPAHSAAVVEDAARAGVKSVWLYRAVGAGSVSGEALGVATLHGLDVVAGECPFMFFPKSGFPHNLHRGWKTLTGALPR